MDDYQEQRGVNPFFIPAARKPTELGEANYPEPSAHGIQPAWGVSISHAENIHLSNIHLETIVPDERPWLHQNDTHRISMKRVWVNKEKQF